MNSSKKILFICHEASLSGAPLVLLNFATWIRRNKHDVVLDILIIKDGDYLENFKSLFDNVFLLEITTKLTTTQKILRDAKSLAGYSREQVILQKIKNNQYDLVYCNTVGMLAWGVKIKNLLPAIRVLLHVHELDTVIKIVEPDFKSLSNYAHVIIGASKNVIQTLINEYGIAKTKVKLIHEFVDFDNHSIPHKLPRQYFKVGASGFYDWRKGYDIFILVADLFKRSYPAIDIQFEWIGGGPPDNHIVVENDIKKLSLENTVKFSGKTNSPLQAFSDFDVFFLASREDPFPLVCLEVGQLGIPIIGFKKAGGVNELLAEGGGVLVDYLNIEKVTQAIYSYAIDQQRRLSDGQKLKSIVSQYSTNIIAPKLYAIVEQQLNSI